MNKKLFLLLGIVFFCSIKFVLPEAPVIKIEEASLLKKFILRNRATVHEPEIRRLNMPCAKKYLDRPAYYEQLCEKKLTVFANDLLEKHGLLDKKISVLVAEENDSNFIYLRGAISIDLIDSALVIIQQEFYQTNTQEVLQALISIHAWEILKNNVITRYCVQKELSIPVIALGTILGAALGGLSSLKFRHNSLNPNIMSTSFSVYAGTMSFFVTSLAYRIAYAKWIQKQVFGADEFSVKVCGAKAVLQMLTSLYELAPQESNWWAELFSVCPSFQKRIAAVKKQEAQKNF